MLREYIKWLFFLSSYSPLFLIIAVKELFNLKMSIPFIAVAVLVNIVVFSILRKSEGMSGSYMTISKEEDCSKSHLEYLVAYIIPFLAFEYSKILDVAALVLIFLLIAYLYVNSDLIYINPALNIFGYRLVKVTQNEKEYMIITKKKHHGKLDRVRIFQISERIGVVSKNVTR